MIHSSKYITNAWFVSEVTTCHRVEAKSRSTRACARQHTDVIPPSAFTVGSISKSRIKTISSISCVTLINRVPREYGCHLHCESIFIRLRTPSVFVCRFQWPLACWDCGFESHRGHGCLSVVSVVCCQVEFSAMSWSLVQRSPTDCDASLCVIFYMP